MLDTLHRSEITDDEDEKNEQEMVEAVNALETRLICTLHRSDMTDDKDEKNEQEMVETESRHNTIADRYGLKKATHAEEKEMLDHGKLSKH